MRLGERIWNLGRLFNLREGFTAADDVLPSRIHEQAFAEGPAAGKVITRKEFAASLAEYYRLRGCGTRTVCRPKRSSRSSRSTCASSAPTCPRGGMPCRGPPDEFRDAVGDRDAAQLAECLPTLPARSTRWMRGDGSSGLMARFFVWSIPRRVPNTSCSGQSAGVPVLTTLTTKFLRTGSPWKLRRLNRSRAGWTGRPGHTDPSEAVDARGDRTRHASRQLFALGGNASGGQRGCEHRSRDREKDTDGKAKRFSHICLGRI